MSSCQDSMDTEDSIPRPEYEDIVLDDEDEDDDEEFWVEKPKAKITSLENGAASSLPVVSAPSTVSVISNPDESLPNKDVDETMEEDYENYEISFGDPDENSEESNVDVHIRKIFDKNVSSDATPTPPNDDELIPLSQRVKSVVATTPVTTEVTASTVAKTKSSSSKPVLVTLIKENGKLILPLASRPPKPVVVATTVTDSLAVTPEEEKISPIGEIKSPQLSTSKEDQPRSSTPSGRGNREFLALQRSFNESKVLSEFVNEKVRGRKSRKVPLRSEELTTGNDGEREKFRISQARSKSCSRTTVRRLTLSSSKHPRKWPSEEKLYNKRENMRSQNTDFVQKQIKFLNRVNHDETADDPMSESSDGEQSINESNKADGSLEIKDDCWQPPPKKGSDSFCWKCKKSSCVLACSNCPRSYHYKCIKIGSTAKLDKTWTCPECVALYNSINGSKNAKKDTLSVDMLSQLLLFALKRMKEIKGHEKLLDVPDESECPLYSRYVVNPVTLNTIQEKIEKKAFRCTDEFVLETKWIQHNVTIAYAAYNSKSILVAKALVKVCRQEAIEIETCSECYLNANTRKDWFVDVCLKPHILLWAKLKGFPYWPAKGMGLGPNSLVNVRFFGKHDRSFVPAKDCFLYSETDPNPHSGKRASRSGIADCIKEVEVHIENIKAKVGAFKCAPGKTQYDPNNEMIQLEEMMPGVTEYVKRQQALQKPPLTYKIVKTAGNSLSIIKKPDSGTESDHSSFGTERNQRNTRASTEKPSPLSEAKKVKEAQNIIQCAPPKPTIINKTIPNKTVSLNYEVVAKPVSKDESNSSKINSVILKRKSDVVLLSPSVKKSKSSEDGQIKEYTYTVSTSPKQEAKLEETQDATPAVPIKRTRSNRSGERALVTQGHLQTPPVQVVVVQPQQTEQPKQQTQQQQAQKPEQQPKPQQASKSDGPTLANKEEAETSSAVVKLVQNRQGVTIKKIQKKLLGINSYFSTEDKGPKVAAEDKTKTAVRQYSHSKLPPLQPKAVPLPAPPPKPVASPPKPAPSPPKPASLSSAPKPSATFRPNVVQSSPKPTPPPPPVEESPIPPKGLIPFEDIKLERAEDEELISTKSTPSTSKAVDPLATTGPNSTSNKYRQQVSAQTPNGGHKTGVSPPINPDLIKSETVSDDESSSNSTPSQENSSPAVAVSKPSSTSTEPARLVGETKIQRITIRSLESLTMQPPPLKSVPPCHVSSRPGTTQSATPPLTTTAQPKKPNARARKSFPNKGPNPAPVMLPPADAKRTLTKNSMVCIPVDSQNNAVPIQPLTAVSKPVNHNQAMVRVTCTTTIPTLNSTQNSLNPVTTSSSVPPFTTSIAVSLPPTAPVTVSSSTVLTDTTNPVSVMVTTVTSSMASRPSYISSLKTLSPLQLTPSNPSAVETEETNEGGGNNNDEEGHILSGIVTPSLAAAITDTIVRGPPRLAPRPNGALRSHGNYGFNSDAGPVCRTLVENAHKMTDFFISVMQDTVNDMANAGVLQAKVVDLQMELETKVASYEKRLYELKQNTDTMLCEMKKSMETERMRIISETRKQCEIERIHAVEQTKKRQWCANCGREANCYCCWNTAYCDTSCQGMDWLRHKPHCCQVNPHLNPELQGPGVLFSAPTAASANSTITTPANPTISFNAPSFLYRPCQPTSIAMPAPPLSSSSILSSSSASLSLASSQTTTITTTATPQKQSGSPINVNTIGACVTADMTFKSKEVLKLPPTTFLRALPPTVRLATPPVHRFNIPLPIAAGATTGGPPYTLVHREGNWELMGTSHATAAVVSSAASFQQPPRLITSVTANLTSDSRSLAPVIVRSNQM